MERSTRQRTAIRNTIEQSERPLAPQEILALAQAEVPQLSLATVYRNLALLQEAGEISTVLLPGDSARYESVHLDHHHHFQCQKCERVFDIPGCVGDLLNSVPRGFVVERHEITLYGTCKGCGPTAKAGGKKRDVSGAATAHSHSHKSHGH
ncbi:MAG: transcriptional repressor [Burkholderiales bacterium]|nr:MAG: transcriptional repressor [Betaproteobacteria bacterium]TAG28895.1 MAG: transcriptional repressor [Burkholderiales bacterium]TAG46126.1 MAG: transcriptional repressor [Betaproteobacteria bacterium]